MEAAAFASSGGGDIVGEEQTFSSTLSVLVVEDDEAQQIIVQELFHKVNQLNGPKGLSTFSINIVSNTTEALHFLKTNRNIAIILLDILLPDINGHDAIPMLRAAAGPRTSIIAMSAHLQASLVKTCKRRGADAFLPKPLQLDDILGLILHGGPRRTTSSTREAEEHSGGHSATADVTASSARSIASAAADAGATSAFEKFIRSEERRSHRGRAAPGASAAAGSARLTIDALASRGGAGGEGEGGSGTGGSGAGGSSVASSSAGGSGAGGSGAGGSGAGGRTSKGGLLPDISDMTLHSQAEPPTAPPPYVPPRGNHSQAEPPTAPPPYVPPRGNPLDRYAPPRNSRSERCRPPAASASTAVVSRQPAAGITSSSQQGNPRQTAGPFEDANNDPNGVCKQQ